MAALKTPLFGLAWGRLMGWSHVCDLHQHKCQLFPSLAKYAAARLRVAASPRRLLARTPGVEVLARAIFTAVQTPQGTINTNVARELSKQQREHRHQPITH